MLYKTRGIVLHSVAYSDAHIIIPVYTEDFGLVSYLASRNRNKKSRASSVLYQPLSILDLEVEHYPLRDLQKIKEAQRHILLSELMFNPLKSEIVLFLAEFIYRISKELQANRSVFEFILESLRILDLLEDGMANFHLVFIIRMSRFLGFYPDAGTYKEHSYFDLQDGVFVERTTPFHPYLNLEESRIFKLLLRMNYENMSKFQFSRSDRVHIINRIMEFYRLHLTAFADMRSLQVLQDVFN